MVSCTGRFTLLQGQIPQRIEQSGKAGFVIDDHNGRMGDFDFPGKIYDVNVDRSTNVQRMLLALIYKSCEFYPINHLNTGWYTFTTNFTYIKSDKKFYLHKISHKLIIYLPTDIVKLNLLILSRKVYNHLIIKCSNVR